MIAAESPRLLAEIVRLWPEDPIQCRLAERTWREEREWLSAFSARSDHGQKLLERQAGCKICLYLKISVGI